MKINVCDIKNLLSAKLEINHNIFKKPYDNSK